MGTDPIPSGPPTPKVQEQMTDVRVQTLWQTERCQCELVFIGAVTVRLRLWVRGMRLVDEEVIDWTEASRRAAELKAEWGAA